MALLLKNILFTVVIPGTVAVYLPLAIARGRSISSSPLWLVIGLALLALGLASYTWCVWDFASFGRGTPLPIDAPRKLVVRGLYRHTRNPMYLGVITVVVGWAAIFAMVWLLTYATALAACCHVFVVLYEEPKLQELFGLEYESYRRAVPRWLTRPR